MLSQREIKDSNYGYLKKVLQPHLDTFERIEQWTDLGNWLQKTAKFLETYPTKQIPCKKNLAKRLSQCLNINLPIGIHRTTLNIYTIIFEYLKTDKKLLANELYIYSFGLFPFFMKSSIQVKPDLIKIFKNYILTLDFQMIPMLSGLIGCLLPALEEQDEILKKDVFDMLQEINNKVGNKFYVNSLWMILLRNSKTRTSTLKVLTKKFQIYFDQKDYDNSSLGQQLIDSDPKIEQMIRDSIKNNNDQNSYFTHPEMIINALSYSLEDEDIVVKKMTLDFMVKFIDLDKIKIFSNEQLKILFLQILKLFVFNDLSLLKRIVKFLFKKNDFSEVNLNDSNQDIITLLENVYYNLLKNTNTDCSLPFVLIQNLKSYHFTLAQHILIKNSYAFFSFCYKRGFNIEYDNNSQVLELTKQFIKNNTEMIKASISNFQAQILQNEEKQDIEFLTFLLKFIILDVNMSQIVQSKFISSLLLISSKTLVQILGKEQINSQELNEIEIFVDFSLNCTNQYQDLNLRNSFSQEKQDPFLIAFENFEEINKKIIVHQNQNPDFINLFQKIYKILIILDDQCNLKEIQTPQDFPNWLNTLLNTLDSQMEVIIYESLQTLYLFFQFENSYQNLKTINQILYKNESFQKDQLGEKILGKLMEIIEIQDYKNLFLNFYRKLLVINFKNVSRYINSMLDVKENILTRFQKVFRLWQYTNQYINTECNYALNKSIKPIFKIKTEKNQMLKNTFKNWLTFSPLSFQIIIDHLTKEVIVSTNWILTDKALLYNHQFETQKILESIKNFEFIFKLCPEYFTVFLTQKLVNKDFSYYQDEVQQTLKGIFKNLENNNIYLFFILQVFLRFFIGNFNSEIEQLKQEHSQGLQIIKEKIALMIELFLKNINDQKLVAQISLEVFTYTVNNYNQALINHQDDSSIIFLNLLKFFCFQTKIASHEITQKNFYKEIQNNDVLKILLNGLHSNNLYLIKEVDSFFNSLNLLASENYSHPELTYIIESILNGYLNAFQDSQLKMEQNQSIKIKEHFKGIGLLILDGLKKFYCYYIEESSIQQIYEKNVLLTMFTLGFAQGEEKTVISFKKDQKTCQKVLQNFPSLFQIMKKYWRELYCIKEQQLYSLFIKNKQIIKKQKDQLQGIEKGIIEILQPFSNQFLKNFLEIMIVSWLGNNLLVREENFQKIDIYKENVKILDIILLLKTPQKQFLSQLKQTEPFKKVPLLKRYKKSTRKYLMIEPIDAKFENDLLSFIYSYIKYQQISKDEYVEVFMNTMEILKLFEQSMIPSTLFWIVDIINMCLCKMSLSTKEFESIKWKYQNTILLIIGNLTRLQIEEYQIDYSKNDEQFNVIFPLNPTVNYEMNSLDKKSLKEQKIFDLKNISNEMNQIRYRFFNQLTFNKTFINICNGFFNDNNTGIYQPQKIRVFYEKILKIFYKRKSEESLFLQKHSELIWRLIKENKYFITEFKNEIFDVFQSDEFFNSEIPTLKIWSEIIQEYLKEINPEILNNYFEKINFTSMFSSKSTENKLRIKSFQRICFIIFSGKKERFVNKEKLKTFLIKIKEVLKDKHVHPYLIILIFFTLRILILRLKRETLDDLLKSLWSSILFLIDEMICKDEQKNQDDIIIAALKLLELISFSDIEEFNLHRWSFIFEYFGINIEKTKNQQSEQIESPFVFNAVLSRKLNKNSQIQYDLSNNDNVQENQENKVKLLMIKNHLEEKQKIEFVAEDFLKYWIKMTSKNRTLDQEQIEELIYGDFIDFRLFINLQQFILKIIIFQYNNE